MCAGAILQARIGQLVWGARNSLLGADGSWIRYNAQSSFLKLSCEFPVIIKGFSGPDLSC